jgi:V-type H+-transporting ATPase subunit E
LLKAAAGRITCDNTLEARLKISVEQCQPEIRTTLFGPSPTRKYYD